MKGSSGKFNWIFFDLDGTLIDSIPASYQAHLDFMVKFGIDSNKKEFEELNGPSIAEIITILKTRYKLAEDKNYLINLYKSEIINGYRNHHIKLFDGAITILKELKKKGYKLALVTSMDQETAMKIIGRQKLVGYFQDYVFGNEVKKAKPDSEIYNLALKKAKVSSDSVAVIEDSYNGVESAKKAGAFVIGIANNQTKEELLKAGADKIIYKLKEILPILGV